MIFKQNPVLCNVSKVKTETATSLAKKPENDVFSRLKRKAYQIAMTKQSNFNNTVHLFCGQ